MHTVLGRNTSLLIARAKANLLRQGKNPGESRTPLVLPPLHFGFQGLSSSGNGGLHLGSLLKIVVFSLLEPGLKEQSLCLPRERAVWGAFKGSVIEYVPNLCRGGKDLVVILHLLGSQIVMQGLCTFY